LQGTLYPPPLRFLDQNLNFIARHIRFFESIYKYLPTPQNFYVNTHKVSYCNVYEKLYAGENYSRTFAKSEELLFDKDAVNFPCSPDEIAVQQVASSISPGEEIATRLSGLSRGIERLLAGQTILRDELLLKYKNFKRPCPPAPWNRRASRLRSYSMGRALRDANLSSNPSDFLSRALLKKMGGRQ